MSARHEFLIRAKALRASTIGKAASLARRSSTSLSRLLFIGLLALPLLYLKVPGRQTLEVVKKPDAVALAPAPQPPLADTEPTEAQTSAPPDTSIPPEAAPAEGEPSGTPPAAEAKPEKPVPPSRQHAPAWTEDEIKEARAECDRLLAGMTLVTEPLPPAREGICGAPAPRELQSIGQSKIKLEPPATLRCPMIAALDTWVTEKVQPAAQKSFNSPVVGIIGGSYSCRNRYGLAKAPVSEHAFMNAIDISGFVLANGKTIRVRNSWNPPELPTTVIVAAKTGTPTGKAKVVITASAKLGAGDVADPAKIKKLSAAEQAAEAQKTAASEFLHQAHDDACSIFGTVLGPDTNDAHKDHFHLDMKERKHGICE